MAKTKTKNLTKEPDLKLSPRWAKFIEYYLESGNAKSAAIQAGFSETYADNITTRFPAKVRKSMVEALESQGITTEQVADRIKALMYASTPIYKNNNESGDIELVGEKPDYIAIDKGVSHAIKIGVGGGYAPEKSVGVRININDIRKKYT